VSAERQENTKYIVPMLSKALDVLEAFSSHREELTLEQIIARTNVAHASAFRIAQTLVHRGYLSRVESKRYKLSWQRRKLRVGYAGLSNEVPFSVALAQSLEAAAKEAGLDLIQRDNRGDAQVAIETARELVDNDIDFALEFQRHEKIAPVLANIFSEAKVKTIAIHIPQPGAIYFGADNYKAGQTAGEALGKYAALKWNGRYDAIALLDVPEGGQALHSRMLGVLHGIQRVLGDAPADRIHWLNGGGRHEISRKVTVNFLKRNPRVQKLLISAVSDHSAMGAVQALKGSRVGATSAVVGHDGDPEALREIAEGGSPYLGTVTFFPERYGRELVELMLRMQRGEPVEPAYYVRHELLDRKASRKLRGEPAR
jgi:ribose transport system substrate-binding protein